MRYFLTPAGLAEKARMSRVILQDSVRFYAGARDRLRESLAVVARQWPVSQGDGPTDKRIVFYGTGEIAEIAYVCLQETDLKLVGVVGETGRDHFFGLPVHRGDDIREGFVGDTPFDCLVVTSFDNREVTRERLDGLGMVPERVYWL